VEFEWKEKEVIVESEAVHCITDLDDHCDNKMRDSAQVREQMRHRPLTARPSWLIRMV
jgi:hypothetical protein